MGTIVDTSKTVNSLTYKVTRTGTMSESADERWAALESNPEVLTGFCHKMGVSPDFEVVDIWGLDPDLLAFVPQPVIAMVLLFPSRNEDGSRAREKLEVERHALSDKIYYLKQIEGLDNACGTIAMIHAILNNRALLGLEGGVSQLEKFYQDTKDMDANSRGKHLDDHQGLTTVHNSLVQEGQSGVISSDCVRHHFVCVTAVDQHLVELDGAYNSGPNIISKIEEGDTLLSSAAKFIKSKYIDSNPDSIQF